MRISRAISMVMLATIGSCSLGTEPEVDGLEQALLQLRTADDLAPAGQITLGGFNMPLSDQTTACPFNASLERFNCPVTTTSAGLTHVRWFELLDADGNSLPTWSGDVDAIRSVNDVSGSVSVIGSGGSTTQLRAQHDDVTFGGLRGATQTLKGGGTSTATFTSTFGSTTQNVTSGSTRSTDLTLAPRGGANVFPTGSITTTVTNAAGAVLQTTTTTYDGTAIVKTTFTDGALVVTCTRDLTKPATGTTCGT